MIRLHIVSINRQKCCGYFKKMKILFIIHALTGGGAERVMATVMNSLCQRGYEVCLLTNTDIPFAYDVDKRIQLLNLNIPCPNNAGFIRRKFWRYTVIRHVAKASKCDVAVSFLAEMNCNSIISLLGTGIPIICSEHSNVLRKYSRWLMVKRSILYHFASVVTVLTRHDYKIWHNTYHNCVRMPNPIDLVESNSSTERKQVVLAVGRVKQWEIKGFDNLIRAWAIICNKFKNWRLQIAGDYDDKSLKELSQVINDVNATNVEFLGFRRDIGALMEKVSVFCLSSRVEGLPMALIEAMNHKCCCVAFDVVTGPNEIIRDGVNGFLVKDQDVDLLAKGLETVLSNTSLRQSFSDSAPSSVKQYETTRVINRWELLFRKYKKQFN